MTASTFDQYGNYLLFLARIHIGKLRTKIEPTDLVQQTLLTAHQTRAKLTETSDEETRAWLRQILAYTISQAMRDLGRQKRNPAREQSLQNSLDHSSRQLYAWLADDQTSPSVRVQHREMVDALAAALNQLSEGQRDALVLHFCEGWTFAQIAEQFGCSAPSVLGLVKRGSRELRKILHEWQ